MRWAPPLQLVDAGDPEDVRPDPLDLRAERDEEVTEILDVGLARGVTDDRLALREHGGHDGVLRRHHGCLVEEQPLAAQTLGAQVVRAVQLDLDAELHERVDVRVEATAADHVPARRRDRRAPEAREEWPGEQERRADLAAEDGVELGPRHLGGVDADLVGPCPRGLGAEVGEDLDHRLDVADPRHVRERDGARGQHGRREDRERPVLVACGANSPRERTSAFDHERLHSGAVSYPAPWRSLATEPGRR